MMLRNGIPFVVGASMLLAATGCPLIEISAEIPEVCLTYADLEVPAADGSGTMSESFVFDDLDGIRDLTDLDAEVEFTSVTLRAKGGVDLAFIDAARVTVASGDPSSALPAMMIVNCSGGSCPVIGDEVTIPSDIQANAISYVESGSILIDIDVSGSLPTTAWKVDVDVCMKGKIAFTQEI